jgi:branched-chain amino acid transport system ATP-binding protein
MGSLLRLENVTQRFGGVIALDSVTFDVNEHCITGLIGPNGSGKTTIFNVVSGVYRPSAGRVLMRDRDITGLSPHLMTRIGIARTFQTPQLFPTLTVRETIEVSASAAGNAKGIGEAIDIARDIGLRQKLDYLPNELTTADMHALEIAKALASTAELILLDEVFAGLSPTEIDRTVKIIREFSRQKTFVIIEHSMRAVMALCEFIHVLIYGRLATSGLPGDVASNPEVIEAYLGQGALANA